MTRNVGSLNVGSTVDGWCTHCKLVLTHTIETMVGEKITRVHCNTCRKQHAYRVSAPRARVAVERRESERAPKEAKSRPTDYAALLRGRTAAAARAYSTSARFQIDELISHPTFGLGTVIGARENAKIDVLFPDGPRVLVHGR